MKAIFSRTPVVLIGLIVAVLGLVAGIALLEGQPAAVAPRAHPASPRSRFMLSGFMLSRIHA